VLKTWLIC